MGPRNAVASTEAAPPSRQSLNLADLTDDETYKILSAAVQPRPIAWVSSLAADGDRNLAPFSFFTVASRDPATVLVSVGVRPGDADRPKDTLANVRSTAEFVVNIPAVEQTDAVALTSRPVEPEVDEFSLAGLTAIPSLTVQPATVAEALISLECRLTAEHPIGSDVVLYGEVLAVSVRAGILDDRFRINTARHGFLGRLAGPFFTSVTESLPQRSGLGVDTPARPSDEAPRDEAPST